MKKLFKKNKLLKCASCIFMLVCVCAASFLFYSGYASVLAVSGQENASAVCAFNGSIGTEDSLVTEQVSYETTAQETTSSGSSSNTNHAGVVSSNPYLIEVNRTQNVVIVYKNDGNGNFTKPVKPMVCSVGANGETPTGTFTTSDKYTWCYLFGDVYGQYATRITGHILFHSVPYFEQSKDTLEYEEFNKLGTAASAGCIRLCVEDAKWIYDNCPSNTVVIIYDSDEEEPLGKPESITIDVTDSRRGWDPTDPDSANPWNK